MRAKLVATGLGLTLALAAGPAFAQHRDHMAWSGAGYGYAPHRPAPASFPVDSALAARCGLRAGSVNPWPTPVAYDRGPPRRWDDDDYGPEPRLIEAPLALSDECAAVLPPGYRLVAVPGAAPECRDEVVTHEEWVPETVTVPRRAAPLRDKRTKLRRID